VSVLDIPRHSRECKCEICEVEDKMLPKMKDYFRNAVIIETEDGQKLNVEMLISTFASLASRSLALQAYIDKNFVKQKEFNSAKGGFH
jgi:hypothetical protein